MAWRWNDNEWNPQRLALAHAVYDVARKEAAYAPMSTPLGAGNLLLRSFPRKYIGRGPAPAAVTDQVVFESIKVRDASTDENRFSGILPSMRGRKYVRPQRGGLYLSEDMHAAMAELFQYADGNLSRRLIGDPRRLKLFTRRAFVSLRPVVELSVVNLESGSTGMLPFLDRLQADAAVAAALHALGYDDLFTALYAQQDYAAARGLGLGLESNVAIDGMRVISARDYETDAGGQRVLRTGDNVMLFGLDQRIASDKVRVESLHLVDAVRDSAELLVTHYKRASKGTFLKAGEHRFMP